MLSRAGLEPQLSISQKLPQNYQFPFATGFRLLSPPSRNQSPERQKRAQVQIPASRSSKTRIPNFACLLPKPRGSGVESLSQRKVIVIDISSRKIKPHSRAQWVYFTYVGIIPFPIALKELFWGASELRD